jgi:hypothetical protein
VVTNAGQTIRKLQPADLRALELPSILEYGEFEGQPQQPQ